MEKDRIFIVDRPVNRRDNYFLCGKPKARTTRFDGRTIRTTATSKGNPAAKRITKVWDLSVPALLGLEFLVASDIVSTVAVGLTFQDLGLLGLLVLIRTLLSFALEVEINGHWPWKSSEMAMKLTAK